MYTSSAHENILKIVHKTIICHTYQQTPFSCSLWSPTEHTLHNYRGAASLRTVSMTSYRFLYTRTRQSALKKWKMTCITTRHGVIFHSPIAIFYYIYYMWSTITDTVVSIMLPMLVDDYITNLEYCIRCSARWLMGWTIPALDWNVFSSNVPLWLLVITLAVAHGPVDALMFHTPLMFVQNSYIPGMPFLLLL